jgi:hypothetical protein
MRGRVRFRKNGRGTTEVAVAVRALNQMLALGRPACGGPRVVILRSERPQPDLGVPPHLQEFASIYSPGKETGPILPQPRWDASGASPDCALTRTASTHQGKQDDHEHSVLLWGAA